MQRAEGLLLLTDPHPSPAFPLALALVCQRIPVKWPGSLVARARPTPTAPTTPLCLSRSQRLYLGGEGMGVVFAFPKPEVRGIIFLLSGILCCFNLSQKPCGRKRRGRREQTEAGSALG